MFLPISKLKSVVGALLKDHPIFIGGVIVFLFVLAILAAA